MATDSARAARHRQPEPPLPVRAHHLLRVRAVWIVPLVMASLVVAAMTALYVSSVVNPLAHLRGLPVAIVNQDRGATLAARQLDIGHQVQAQLLATQAVADRLSLTASTLSEAEHEMDHDGLYAALVIPPDFTTSLVSGTTARVEILTNQRAGTVGASLATGILQPALAATSQQLGQRLARPGVTTTPPITVTTADYRPLPANTALGLSPFYMALLTIMCGFLGATIVNSVVDSALGYAVNEIGPRWRQRQPVPINRWHTLLIKWAVIAALMAVLTGIMLAVASGGLGLDTPHPVLLWLFTWLCATSVGAGTLMFFAAAGSSGQLIGLLVFVYAGLASVGATVPLEALPSVLRAASSVEPLHQILAGTRSIMYFGAAGDAGLAEAILTVGVELAFWLIAGAVVVKWYDYRRRYRLHPDLLTQVGKFVHVYRALRITPARVHSHSRQLNNVASSIRP